MRWFHRCRGPIIQAEPLKITKAEPPYTIGWWTRVICRCKECGDTFEPRPKPGKLKLDEDGNLVPSGSTV